MGPALETPPTVDVNVEDEGVTTAPEQTEITRVLVCGDQPFYRSAVSSLIEHNNGFRRAAESTTRIEELEQALQSGVDIVVIDFDLFPQPGHDLPALERLLDAVAPRPVVLICSALDPDECVAVLRHGTSGVVAKSSGGDVLHQALDSVHRGQIWLDRALLADEFDDSQARRRARSEAAKVEQLTPRERKIFHVACTGVTNKQIGQQLSISEATVRHHFGSIFAKLGVSTRAELVAYGYRHKLQARFAESQQPG